VWLHICDRFLSVLSDEDRRVLEDHFDLALTRYRPSAMRLTLRRSRGPAAERHGALGDSDIPPPSASGEGTGVTSPCMYLGIASSLLLLPPPAWYFCFVVLAAWNIG
jgi:hypothetical protein